jgi:hypothetical protein
MRPHPVINSTETPSSQEVIGLEHYRRLLAEGRVAPPEAIVPAQTEEEKFTEKALALSDAEAPPPPPTPSHKTYLFNGFGKTIPPQNR